MEKEVSAEMSSGQSIVVDTSGYNWILAGDGVEVIRKRKFWGSR